MEGDGGGVECDAPLSCWDRRRGFRRPLVRGRDLAGRFNVDLLLFKIACSKALALLPDHAVGSFEEEREGTQPSQPEEPNFVITPSRSSFD